MLRSSRIRSISSRLLRPATQRNVTIGFFDSKPYWEKYFNECNTNMGLHYDIRYFESKLTMETSVLAHGCDAVCVFVNDKCTPEVLSQLAKQNVKLVTLRCAGFNNVNLPAAKEFGVSVTRVPAYSPYAVAEFTLTLLMALNRKIAKAYSRTRTGNFSLNGLVGWDIHGKTAGIVGTGMIGKVFARIMLGLGCKVLCYDINPDPELTKCDNVSYVSLDTLFSSSHIISLHVPLCPSTVHMINDATIASMRDGVYMLNTSRGALVDSQALITGLKTGKIAGAALDVYEEESDYFYQDKSDTNIADETLLRLLSFNNVIVTSHQAFLTEDALTNIATTTLESVQEYMSGVKGANMKYTVLKEK